MVQCFGCAGHDQSIDAVTILLVEKTYVNKQQHQLWMTKFGGTLTRSPKCVADSDDVLRSPQKHHILGEQGNMVEAFIDPCDVAANEEPSAKELLLWQQMESVPDIETLRVSSLIIDTVEASTGTTRQIVEAGDVGGEDDNSDNEDENNRENHQSHFVVSDTKKAKQEGQKKKKGLQGSKASSIEIDFNLATFLHNNLLPVSDPRAGC